MTPGWCERCRQRPPTHVLVGPAHAWTGARVCDSCRDSLDRYMLPGETWETWPEEEKREVRGE